MLISAEDRKKFKKMRVWDANDDDKYECIVLFTTLNGGCAAVYSMDEESFLNGGRFRVANWDNYEPIPEPKTEIWSWEKAVVWSNKQGNVVFRCDDNLMFSSVTKNFYEEEVMYWNILNDDGTYKYDEWRTFCDKDCLGE